MTSPNARSLNYLRKHGAADADVVEKFIPGANIRRDLFGCLDLLATAPVDGRFQLIGVQATTAPNLASRQTKMEGMADVLIRLFQCGVEVQAWGWKCKEIPSRTGKKPTRRWSLIRRRAVIGYDGIDWETVTGDALI